jgi:hypothetical protein
MIRMMIITLMEALKEFLMVLRFLHVIDKSEVVGPHM